MLLRRSLIKKPTGLITLVGSPTEGSAIDGLDITLSLPTGMQRGDMVYVYHALNTALGGGTTSTGWTQVATVDSGLTRSEIFRKRMESTLDTQIVLTGSANVQRVSGAVAFALRGVDASNPEDATPTNATASSTDPDSPSITTQTPYAWVLSFMHTRIRDLAVTAPSGYSNQVDVDADDTIDITVGGATREIAFPGAENPAAWTNVTSGEWVAWSVAVRPA
jgi:hypothetical protein